MGSRGFLSPTSVEEPSNRFCRDASVPVHIQKHGNRDLTDPAEREGSQAHTVALFMETSPGIPSAWNHKIPSLCSYMNNFDCILPAKITKCW